MNMGSRASRVGTSLTPQGCVLLFVKEAQQAGPFLEFNSRLAKLPLAEYPRNRTRTQATAAVREAMKGQPRDRIRDAMRAAAKEADFLTLLVSEVNLAVLRDTECRQLTLKSLTEEVRHRKRRWKGEEHDWWMYRFLINAGYIGTLKLAIRHIECEHFSGTPLLFSDACQALDVELDLVHATSRVYDEVVAGSPGPLFEPECLTEHLKSVWLFVAQYLIARARSGTLRAFNLYEASVDVMRPYWSGKAMEDWLNSDR